MKELREKIVEEAKSWLGTNWHHEARVKGGGVDCGMLLLEVFKNAGIIPYIKPTHYGPDFMCHRDEEWFLDIVKQYADEVQEDPLPGDVIIYKIGRLFCHGMIIIDYPMAIHAHKNEKAVVWCDVSRPPWINKDKKMFRARVLSGGII